LADKKITQLTNITGADLANADEFVVVDITADETKAITFDELKTAFDTGTGFVRVTGDTMTGALDVESTITSDGMIVDGNVTLGDNDKALFGAGSDLQIYHTGSTSYISDIGSGDLLIQGSSLIRLTNTSGANYFQGTDGGQVQLYYGGATKLTTTSTGIAVTGTVTSDDYHVKTGGHIEFDFNGSSTHFTGTNSPHIFAGSGGSGAYLAGTLNLQSRPTLDRDINLITGATPSKTLTAHGNGDISFYEDTGTTAKFFWDASAESLGLGTSSPSRVLHTSGDVVRFDNAGPSAILLLDTTNNEGFRLVTNRTSGAFSIEDMGTATSGAGTERMVISSTGQVGIGTSSPSQKAEVSNNANSSTWLKVSNSDTGAGAASGVLFENDSGEGGAISLRSSAVGGDLLLRTLSTNPLTFATNNTERMRIDSSGNLLVGTTDNFPGFNDTNTGTSITSTGRIFASASGEFSQFNRNSSDGDIVAFRKDGTAVGSVGTYSGDFWIGQGNTGLLFDDGGDILRPANASGGNRDGNYDLGTSSSRFKNLYLSGGVYLGGTGSANKLDDYEEGTWTPAFLNFNGTSGWGFSNAKYTKIGNLVYLSCDISGGSGTLISAQNASRLTGMPFVVSGTYSPCSFATNYITDEGTGVLYGNVVYSPAFSITNEKVIYFSGVYQTAT